jgi:hypothetical protein
MPLHRIMIIHSLRFCHFSQCGAFALIWINIKCAKFAAIRRNARLHCKRRGGTARVLLLETALVATLIVASVHEKPLWQ